jgi:hypothetical protein
MSNCYLKFYDDCPKKIRKKLGFEIKDDELKQIHEKPQLTGVILIKSNREPILNGETKSLPKPTGLENKNKKQRLKQNTVTTPIVTSQTYLKTELKSNSNIVSHQTTAIKTSICMPNATSVSLKQAKSYKEHLEMKKKLEQQQQELRLKQQGQQQAQIKVDQVKCKKIQLNSTAVTQQTFKIKPMVVPTVEESINSSRKKHALNGHHDNNFRAKKLHLSSTQATIT